MILLRHLNYFLAIAHSGTFTRAAEELQISQPALSQQIKKLESILGVDLFYRTARRVELTDAGKAFLECAHRVLKELADGERALQEVKTLARGTLKLGVSSAFMINYLKPSLGAYTSKYPLIKIVISELNANDIESELLKGTLDIGFTFNVMRNHLIESVSAFMDPIALVVGQAHPLYNTYLSPSRKDVAQLDFAVLTSDFEIRKSFDEYFGAFRPKRIIEVGSVEELMEIICKYPVATMLPTGATYQDSTLYEVPLIERPNLPEAVFVRRRGEYHSASSIAFLNLAMDMYGGILRYEAFDPSI